MPFAQFHPRLDPSLLWQVDGHRLLLSFPTKTGSWVGAVSGGVSDRLQSLAETYTAGYSVGPV